MSSKRTRFEQKEDVGESMKRLLKTCETVDEASDKEIEDLAIERAEFISSNEREELFRQLMLPSFRRDKYLICSLLGAPIASQAAEVLFNATATPSSDPSTLQFKTMMRIARERPVELKTLLPRLLEHVYVTLWLTSENHLNRVLLPPEAKKLRDDLEAKSKALVLPSWAKRVYRARDEYAAFLADSWTDPNLWTEQNIWEIIEGYWAGYDHPEVANELWVLFQNQGTFEHIGRVRSSRASFVAAIRRFVDDCKFRKFDLMEPPQEYWALEKEFVGKTIIDDPDTFILNEALSEFIRFVFEEVKETSTEPHYTSDDEEYPQID